MRKYLIISAAALLLSSSYALAADAGVLKDSDIPALRDALKKSYTLDICHNDLPGASIATCDCLGDEMAKNLNGANLLLCKKDGYDTCVATEFTAAKSALTEKQINDCKALSSAGATVTAPETKTDIKTKDTNAAPATKTEETTTEETTTTPAASDDTQQ